MVGGYLRTNYRRTGGKLDKDALGRGFARGSWIAGAGVADVYGVVAGSYSGNGTNFASTSQVLSIEAASALASFYGCDKMNPLTGYKIFPFNIQARPGSKCSGAAQGAIGESGLLVEIFGSVCAGSAGASQMFFWAGASGISVAGSEWSAHFNWVGLIISAP